MVRIISISFISPRPELPTGGADQLRDKVYSPTQGQLGFLFLPLCKERALARVSKDGHRRDRVRGHPSSFESLRTAALRVRFET
jgi:hypothetical protein